MDILTSNEETAAKDSYITNRSLQRYYDYLEFTEKDLKLWKVVVDLGSGVEQVLARDCRKMGLSTEIISIDPRLALPEEKDLTFLIDDEDIERRRNARNNPQKGTIAAISQHLPLMSNSVDEILALYSVPLYLFGRESDINKTFTEIARVLKVGGEARMYPVDPHNASGKAVESAISKCEDLEIVNKIRRDENNDKTLILRKNTNQS